MAVSKWPEDKKKDRPHEFVWCEVNDCVRLFTQSSVNIGGQWFPLSQLRTICYEEVGDSKELRKGDQVTHIEITKWLADKKGLNYETD